MYFARSSLMRSRRDYNRGGRHWTQRSQDRRDRKEERRMMLKNFSRRSCSVPVLLCTLCVLCDLCATTARGHDFVKESAPQRWIEPLVPEDLPPLKYPSYFNDLDKA